MNIVILGLTVTSTWGNGHGTTYRALLRALRERGHHITFFEKDVEWYGSNRDLPEPDFCHLRLYTAWSDVLPEARRALDGADVAIVGSYFPDGIAAINEMLGSKARVKTFYDIDTPITIAALRDNDTADYIAARQIPSLDLYFSFTGGPILREIEQRFSARRAVPLYCSIDPRTYRRRGVNKKFACDLSYMGTFARDRQPKLEGLLCAPARQLPHKSFIVAGSQYPKSLPWPGNVRRIAHLNPRWHPSLYSSSRFTLNVTRRDMVMAGYSPSVRLFEAAACGATVISDNWPGLDSFFTPGEEILLPVYSHDVVRWLTKLSDREILHVGKAAQARVMTEHTSQERAREFERAVESGLCWQQQRLHSTVPAGGPSSTAARDGTNSEGLDER